MLQERPGVLSIGVRLGSGDEAGATTMKQGTLSA